MNKFIGAEVPEALYERFSEAARRTHRSRSGLIRYLIENSDFILSGGDNHLADAPLSPASDAASPAPAGSARTHSRQP